MPLPATNCPRSPLVSTIGTLSLWLSFLLVAPIVAPSIAARSASGQSSPQARPQAAQPTTPQADEPGPSGEVITEWVEDTSEAADEDPDEASETAADDAPRMKLLDLLRRGGPVMIPIYAVSILAAALAFERLLNLRWGKVIPPRLEDGLNQLAMTPAGFDPRKAYRLTQEYPSPTASVVRAMLLKVGRPHSEIETAVTEATQREGVRLYANVRWLHLLAAVAPLLGLFGTVWGMIRAFFDYSNLAVGQNKATFLATGIYEALVTTLAGLAVAIPAAMLAYYFEGRVEAITRRIDELLFQWLPHVERFEGRLRVSQHQLQVGEPPVVPTTGSAGERPASRSSSTGERVPHGIAEPPQPSAAHRTPTVNR